MINSLIKNETVVNMLLLDKYEDPIFIESIEKGEFYCDGAFIGNIGGIQ